MERTASERLTRYVLDGSDADLRRLLKISQISEAQARKALAGAGIGDGWRVIECGCGPIGALPILADLVGPTGRVTGLDFVPSTVERARQVVGELELSNVEVTVGDVNDAAVAADLEGPFDAAYCRCFLMHQPSTVHTLGRMAALLRPGGVIVAQEPLASPTWRSAPPFDDAAIRREWAIVHQTMAASGAQPDAVDSLAASAREAGLEVVTVVGSFAVIDGASGFELHAATMAAVKDRAVALGVAAESEIDELEMTFRREAEGAYDWVSSPIYLEAVLRKPIAV